MDFLFIVLLLFTGLVFIALEIFLLPGLLTGIMGLIIIISALIYSFVKFQYEGSFLSILITIISFIILFSFIKSSNAQSRFILKDEISYKFSEDLELNMNLVGKEGIALIDLKRSGFI